MTQAASAADAIWTGLGADSLWTTTGNWNTSPVPGAGNTATFNGAGNGKTTITTAPAALTSYIFDAGSAAYTISASATTWSVPNGGGVTINSGVSATQDLSGIQFIRPASGSTTNFINQGSGLLKLGTIFHNNASSPATANALLRFAPASGATIEVISGKIVDNARGFSSSDPRPLRISVFQFLPFDPFASGGRHPQGGVRFWISGLRPHFLGP